MLPPVDPMCYKMVIWPALVLDLVGERSACCDLHAGTVAAADALRSRQTVPGCTAATADSIQVQEAQLYRGGAHVWQLEMNNLTETLSELKSCYGYCH
jgi:hypothetical protein